MKARTLTEAQLDAALRSEARGPGGAGNGGDVDYVCSALGNLVAGDTLDAQDAAIIDRARDLIRRLASTHTGEGEGA